MGGNDVLIGGLGDDLLDGGDGSDAARYSGNRADYQLANVDGTVTVVDLRADATGKQGRDTLIDAEPPEFAARTIAPPHTDDRRPRPAALSTTLARHRRLAQNPQTAP